MTGWELDRGEDAGGEKSGGKAPGGKRRGENAGGGGGNRLIPVKTYREYRRYFHCSFIFTSP